jgi:TolB-like protein
VIGRRSAFAFKGKNEDLRLIGRTLGVAHLLEGSVRKAGTHVRIAAQLVKASDGSQVWAETYDRELKDIFAVQDEITRSATRPCWPAPWGVGTRRLRSSSAIWKPIR